ncbi:MAG: AAA family ATPase [Hominenteromicrobium sp.]
MDEKIESVQEEKSAIDLSMVFHDFFRGLKKFWWVVVALTVILAGYSYVSAASSYRPMYRCDASFTVTTSSSGSASSSYQFYYDQSTAAQMATTFPYILDSALLTDMVKQDLGVDYINGSISASSVENSNLFTLSVVSSSPEDALRILESVIDNYPEVSQYVIGDTMLNMIDAPKLPTEPYNTRGGKREAVQGAMRGFLLGMAFLVLYAVTRRTIRKEEEVKEKLNVQCVGIVPKVVFKKRSRKIDETLSIFNGKIGDYFRESIRGIALRLQRQMDEKGEKVLMVTGTTPGEGSSTVAENLAYALAEMGKKVILLDADLRQNGKKNALAGKEETQGLERFLLGECPLSEVLIRDHQAHIWRVGCRNGLNTREILSVANNLHSLIEWMKKNVDYVVMDAPDCSHMSDVAIAAENADTVVYVIEQDYAKTYKIMEGIEDVSRYGVTFAGCVLNKTQVGLSGYGYGKYGKYYGKYAYSKYGSYGRYGYSKYGYGKYGYGYGSDPDSKSGSKSRSKASRSESNERQVD